MIEFSWIDGEEGILHVERHSVDSEGYRQLLDMKLEEIILKVAFAKVITMQEVLANE